MSEGFSVTIEPEIRRKVWTSVDVVTAEGLRRENEEEDTRFYAVARKRPFFRQPTNIAIRRHYSRLIPSGATRVLDLMASMESHLPDLPGCEVVGLGLNEDEMRSNSALQVRVVHDLNRQGELPFESASFDAVVCSGGIGLLARPVELMREIGRTLRAGGLLAVSFTDRTIQPKSITAWRDETNEGRLVLATAYFSFSGSFLRPFVEVEELSVPECIVAGPGGSIGDELLSVVWGYRPPADPTRMVTHRQGRLARVHAATERHCPYCGEQMLLWQPPETPWEIDYNAQLLYVCFNDGCEYFTRGAKWCRRNGMRCASYRHSLNPGNGKEAPLPVPTRWALRAGIVEEA